MLRFVGPGCDLERGDGGLVIRGADPALVAGHGLEGLDQGAEAVDRCSVVEGGAAGLAPGVLGALGERGQDC